MAVSSLQPPGDGAHGLLALGGLFHLLQQAAHLQRVRRRIDQAARRIERRRAKGLLLLRLGDHRAQPRLARAERQHSQRIHAPALVLMPQFGHQTVVARQIVKCALLAAQRELPGGGALGVGVARAGAVHHHLPALPDRHPLDIIRIAERVRPGEEQQRAVGLQQPGDLAQQTVVNRLRRAGGNNGPQHTMMGLRLGERPLKLAQAAQVVQHDGNRPRKRRERLHLGIVKRAHLPMDNEQAAHHAPARP
jgi:hypothetical protein